MTRAKYLSISRVVSIIAIALPAISPQQASAEKIPLGYTTFVSSTQSENIIFVRGDDYLVPCFSRNPKECPASGLDYGGKIVKIKPGVVKVKEGNFYFCAGDTIPKGAQGRCAAGGFVRNK